MRHSSCRATRPLKLTRFCASLRLWLIGFSIFITSNVLGTIFQVGALPIVVLAPLGAVSLLWNALFARLLLGDVFTRYMVLGSFFQPLQPRAELIEPVLC